MNAAALQARWENQMRKRLNEIRAAAFELAVEIEFTGYPNAVDLPLHQFAVDVVDRCDYFKTNAKGELEYPKTGEVEP